MDASTWSSFTNTMVLCLLSNSPKLFHDVDFIKVVCEICFIRKDENTSEKTKICIKHAPNENFARFILGRDPNALRYADAWITNNPSLVGEAVAHTPMAFEFAHPELQGKREASLCRKDSRNEESRERCGSLASERHAIVYNLFETAVKGDPLALAFGSNYLKSLSHFCEIAVYGNYAALEFCRPRERNDEKGRTRIHQGLSKKEYGELIQHVEDRLASDLKLGSREACKKAAQSAVMNLVGCATVDGCTEDAKLEALKKFDALKQGRSYNEKLEESEKPEESEEPEEPEKSEEVPPKRRRTDQNDHR